MISISQAKNCGGSCAVVFGVLWFVGVFFGLCVVFFPLLPPVTSQLSHNWPLKCAFLSGMICFVICR